MLRDSALDCHGIVATRRRVARFIGHDIAQDVANASGGVENHKTARSSLADGAFRINQVPGVASSSPNSGV